MRAAASRKGGRSSARERSGVSRWACMEMLIAPTTRPVASRTGIGEGSQALFELIADQGVPVLGHLVEDAAEPVGYR